MGVPTEVMARETSGAMEWVATEAMAWEAMAGVSLEVMAWVASGLLTASPTMDLALMVNLKIMISSLLLVVNNLCQLIPPRMVKSNSRSSLLDISHPITGISLSIPSNLPTSYLVTLGHLLMDSSLLTLNMQLLDPDLLGSGSALPLISVSYGYLSRLPCIICNKTN